MARAKPLHINKLSAKHVYALTNMVDAEFVNSNMNDTEFAAKAEKELGFMCTTHNVAGARETLGIPSKKVAIAAAKQQLPLDIEALKEILLRLDTVEKTLSILMLAAKHNYKL